MIKCSITRIDFTKPNYLKRIAYFRKWCDDDMFPKGYECAKSLQFDYMTRFLYIAYDPKNRKVCGWVFVFDDGKSISMESIASRSGKDPQYKGNMILLFNKIIRDARVSGKKFARISGFTNEGVRFYTKYGFKILGNTGTLVYPITSLPHVQNIRDVETRHHTLTSLHNGKPFRIGFSKKKDTLERLQRTYGEYDVDTAEMLGVEPQEIGIVLTDFSNVKPFPNWMYKGSHSKFIQ